MDTNNNVVKVGGCWVEREKGGKGGTWKEKMGDISNTVNNKRKNTGR